MNLEHYEKFINFIHDPSFGCLEFVCWKAKAKYNGYIGKHEKYGRTLGGWYTKLDHLKFDVGRLQGVSGYICLNPVNTELLNRSNNEITAITRNNGTKEENILTFRHFLIDIDCKRPSDMVPANDRELQSCLDLRDRILSDHPEIASNALWGCSGNGAYIVVRIQDYPVRIGRDLVRSTLQSLANTYGKKTRDNTFIDTNTFSPVFHVGVPGTLKCKGNPTPERPHRLITVDGCARAIEKDPSCKVSI